MESDIVDRFNDPPLDTSPSTPAASTPDRLPPLKVPITLYRFFTIALGLALGIPKAVCAAKGQSVIAEDLDWVWGLVAPRRLFHVHSPTLCQMCRH